MLKFLKKVNFKHLFWFFLYFFIFCLLLRNSFSYLDPDLGWHLKVGQEISQTKVVPSLNHYNYTFTGNWVDHEWLSNFLVYFTYDRLGYIGLSIIFSLLAVSVFVLLNIAAKRVRPESHFLIVFLQIIGCLAILPHLGIRIQEVGLLFLFFLLSILNIYSKRKDWRVLLFLPFLMYLWSCLHASFLLGFFLLGAWFCIEVINNFFDRFFRKPWLDSHLTLSFRESLIFFSISALSFGATLLTPYKLSLYAFLGGYQNTFYLSRLQEWLSQFSFPLQYLQLFYLALVTMALIFYIYYSFTKEKYFKINLWNLFLVILFIGLSFKSRRHFPLLFVATFVFLVEVYGVIIQTSISNVGRKSLNAWLEFYLLTCLFLVATFLLVETKFTNDPFKYYCHSYPCGATEYLANNSSLDSLKIFSDYGWGGYLIWRLPDRQLFIDGRLPQIKFAGHTFLEEYLTFFKSGEGIKEKLDQYQIRLILLPAEDKKISVKNWEKIIFGIKDEELENRNYLREYISISSDWRKIYFDQASVIYAR